MDQEETQSIMEPLRDLQNTHKMLSRGFLDLLKEYNKNEADVFSNIQREVEILASELEGKKRDLTRCEENLKMREAELNSIRKSFFKCEDVRWVPEADQSIRSTVEDVQEQIRTWAKDYGPETFPDLFELEMSDFESFFQRVYEITGYKNIHDLGTLEHPFLILAALLCEFTRTHILSDPFFHFRDPDDADHRSSFAGKLAKLYSGMLKDDAQKAISWRKQMFRHEFPSSRNVSTNRSNQDELLTPNCTKKETLIRMYNNLADMFVNAIPTQMLNDHERTEKMRDDLDHILKRAGNLHFRLLTQQTRFVWLSPVLQVGTEFRVSNDEYWIDHFHHLDNGEDRSWDGAIIKVVVGMGLSADGHALGENIPRSRIIAPSRLFLKKTPKTDDTHSQRHSNRILDAQQIAIWPSAFDS
ncbi:uncharacterized protein BKA78DRAFT_352520 [Phyllosticta capitalensis]|uniref:uncharacterized protein n=1 Tax=Phyllosticta capitalensis TaxID=121624 RepID=UPI00313010EC